MSGILKKLNRDIGCISQYKIGRYVKFRAILSPSFMCVFIYRVSNLLVLLRLPILPKLFWWFNYIVFKVDIDPRSTIEGGIYMPHPMMIVIGRHVRIYSDVKIMQGVTIGGNLGKTRHVSKYGIVEQPIIEGNSFLGIGAILAGPLIIKGLTFIAAREIVTKDIEAGTCYYQNESGKLTTNMVLEIPNE